VLLFSRLDPKHMQRETIFVHRQINRAHQQTWMSENLRSPNAGPGSPQQAHTALGNSPETEAQLIDNIPEGNLAFPKGRLAFPNTSTVKAAVDAQAQLDQQG